jgi:hypothetical protein
MERRLKRLRHDQAKKNDWEMKLKEKGGFNQSWITPQAEGFYRKSVL